MKEFARSSTTSTESNNVSSTNNNMSSLLGNAQTTDN